MPLPRPTVEEFLAWETSQYDRHEFWRGQALRKADGGRAHDLVCLNLALAFKAQLNASSWAVCIEGMPLQIGREAVFYPDVLVTRDPLDWRADRLVQAPTLVAEVLTPATEALDRGGKFAAYRRLPSLREYLLVDPVGLEVLVFRREAADGLFTLHDFSPGPDLVLPSLGAQLSLAGLFDGVVAESWA